MAQDNSFAPSACADCSKSYSTKNILTRHKRNHKATKQQRCHVCGVAFQRQDLLNRHLKIHARTPPLGQRQRCNTACVNCRRARAKCDGLLPCAPCARQGKTCRFEQPRRRQSKSIIFSSMPQPGPSPVVAGGVSHGQIFQTAGENAFLYQDTFPSHSTGSPPQDYTPIIFVPEPVALEESQPQPIDFSPGYHIGAMTQTDGVDVPGPADLLPFPDPELRRAQTHPIDFSDIDWQRAYEELFSLPSWSSTFFSGNAAFPTPTPAPQDPVWPSVPNSLPVLWPLC